MSTTFVARVTISACVNDISLSAKEMARSLNEVILVVASNVKAFSKCE